MAALCRCVISSVLGGLTAQLLVPKNLAATLKLEQPGWKGGEGIDSSGDWG